MTNTRLNAVYNGNEIITSNGFIMQSRFMVAVLSRLQTEKLLTKTGAELIQAIFIYKHDERKPYPTYEELSEYLGKSISTIEKGMLSIKQCKLLGIKKVKEKTGESCRNNVYDFAPFFALLEKFIQVFHIEGRKDVTITELLKMKVEKKAKKAFKWAKDKKVENEVASDVAEEPEQPVVPEEPTAPEQPEQPAMPEQPVAPVCVLPETIKNVVEFYNINAEGIEAIKKAYTSFSATLDDKIFIEKIVASSGKSNFINYFSTCITNAYATNEQPKQAPKKEAPAPRNNTYNKPATPAKPVKTEITPDWFDKGVRKKEEEQRIAEEIEARKAIETKIVETDCVEKLDELLSTITLTSEQQVIADNHREHLAQQFILEREKVMRKLKGLSEPKTTTEGE